MIDPIGFVVGSAYAVVTLGASSVLLARAVRTGTRILLAIAMQIVAVLFAAGLLLSVVLDMSQAGTLVVGMGMGSFTGYLVLEVLER